MERQKALASIKPAKTTTQVKAWVMKAGTDHYQICEYSGRIVGIKTSIWKSNSTASKRTSDIIFEINGMDHMKCAEEFLTHLGIFDNENL
jgi:hypothetical protein